MGRPQTRQPGMNLTLAAIIGLAVWFLFFLVLAAAEATRIQMGFDDFEGTCFSSAIGASVLAIACKDRPKVALAIYVLVGALFLAFLGLSVLSYGSQSAWFSQPAAHAVSATAAFVIVRLIPWPAAKWSFPIVLLAGGWIGTVVHVRAVDAEIARDVSEIAQWLPGEFEEAVLPRLASLDGVDWSEPSVRGRQWSVVGQVRDGKGDAKLDGWGRWTAHYELRLVASSPFDNGSGDDATVRQRTQDWLRSQGVGPELVENLERFRHPLMSFLKKGETVHIRPDGGTLEVSGTVQIDPQARKIK